MSHTLNKKDRLKSYTKIRMLFETGERLKQFPLKVYYLFEDKALSKEAVNSLQMGVAVGTKHFKRAVDRNLLKRRIREAYRLQNGELKLQLNESPFTLNVFFVYGDNVVTDYGTISLAINKILISLLKIHVDKMKIVHDGNG